MALPEITFYPKAHRYKVNGEWCPNVTTILGIVDKPYLIPWYVKKSVEYIERNLGVLSSPHTTDELAKKIIEAAKNKGDQARDEAAEAGRLAHNEIERIIKGEITWVEADERVLHVVKEFIKWKDFSRFEILRLDGRIFSEVRLASLDHWYVGTSDMFCKVYGRLEVVDYKSGKRVSAYMGKQLAAYKRAFEEMFPGAPPVEGMSILRIGFLDGKTEHIPFEDYDFFFSGFLSSLGTYRWETESERLFKRFAVQKKRQEEPHEISRTVELGVGRSEVPDGTVTGGVGENRDRDAQGEGREVDRGNAGTQADLL